MGGVGSGGHRNGGGIDHTTPDGAPDIRDDAPEEIQEVFHQLLKVLPKDSLRRIDSYMLEQLATLIVQQRNLQQVIATDPLDHKSSGVYLRVSGEISKLSGRFGLSPADRKRMALEAEEKADDFTEWIGG